MAKLLGFELKSVKEFKDRYGYPICQGNVYFRGKKLGFWSQDGWGGPDQFDFDVTPYNKAMKEMDLVETLNLSTPYGFTLEPDMDILMGELLRLKDTEKHYKHLVKHGYPEKMALIENTREGLQLFAPLNRDGDAEKEAAKEAKGAVKENGWDAKDVKVLVLTDVNSFVVGEALEVA